MDQDTPAPLDPHIWKVASVVMCGPFMSNLDATVVNLSLTTMAQELGSRLSVIQWVSSAYLLTLALVLPLSGWLVDRIGPKRMYIGCFVGFTLTSLLCGFAQSSGALIFYRCLQGIAGGLMAPMAQTMLVRMAGPHYAKVMSICTLPVLLAPILGPVLAGVILQYASWPWIFFVNLPIGLIALTLTAKLLPPGNPYKTQRPFDFVGFALIAPGMVLLLNGLAVLKGADDAETMAWMQIGMGVIFLLLFAIHSVYRPTKALIDLRLFKGVFLATALLLFFSNAISFASQMLIPMYYLRVHQDPTSTAGLLMAHTGMGVLCMLPFVASLNERFGPRCLVITGMFLTLLGTLPFGMTAWHASDAWLGMSLFVRGIGIGLVGIPATSAAYAAIRPEAVARATTAIAVVQRLGGPVGTTVLAIFLHHMIVTLASASKSVSFHDAPLYAIAPAFELTFQVLCVFTVLAVIPALFLPSKVPACPHPHAHDPDHHVLSHHHMHS